MADLDPAMLEKFRQLQIIMAESPELIEAMKSPELLALATKLQAEKQQPDEIQLPGEMPSSFVEALHYTKRAKLAADENRVLAKVRGGRMSHDEAIRSFFISNGLQYNLLTQIVEPRLENYDGSYNQLSGRIRSDKWKDKLRPRNYNVLIRKISDHVHKESGAGFEIGTIGVPSFHESLADCGSSTIGDSRVSGLSENMQHRRKQKKTLTGGPTIFGKEGGNLAHLAIPNKRGECGIIHSIYTPSVLGMDTKEFLGLRGEIGSERETLIQIMQLAAVGMEIEDGKGGISTKNPFKYQKHVGIGLSDLTENLLKIPMDGHQSHFDGEKADWFFLPVTSLQDAIDYDETEDLKVIAIVGLFPKQDKSKEIGDNSSQSERYNKKHAKVALEEVVDANWKASASLFQGHQFDFSETKWAVQGFASSEEIKTAIGFLSECVKGLADLVVNGHPAHGAKPLMPMDFDRKDHTLSAQKVRMMKDTKESLESKGVWVPKIIDEEGLGKVEVLRITLKGEAPEPKGGEPKGPTPPKPDPMLLGIKNAINWMAQFDQKPLPACQNLPREHEEEDFYSEDEKFILHHVSTPARHRSTFVPPAIVTPEPVDIIDEDLSVSDYSLGDSFDDDSYP